MRREHLERFRPTCPTCRAAGRAPGELELGTVALEERGDVLEGALVCGEAGCRREHPVIDGIPVVVGDLTSWASHQLDAVLRRDDLSPFLESLLGDAAGPLSTFERERSNVGGYGRAHWGDLGRHGGDGRGHEFPELVERALALLDAPPSGAWIDHGCAVGRGVYELARRTGELAVGVDLSFAMLRVAERVRREGRAVFSVKRVGLVYDRHEIEIADVPRERMSFWCCDAAALPFADGAFAGALSLNVLDCVASPLGHLLELGRTLEPRAPAILSTPFDWSPAATSVEHWIGGHSQRGGSGGSSVRELRRILSDDADAGVDTGLVVVDERDRVPWRVHSNERSSTEYSLHLLKLQRSG